MQRSVIELDLSERVVQYKKVCCWYFDDDGIAGEKSRGDRVEQVMEWIVPRHDRSYDS